MTAEQKNRISGWLKWFDPLGKAPGSFGFMINRITGIGLVIYLFLHLIMLGKLVTGEKAFDDFIALAQNPIIVAGEILVVAAVFLHGINGLRIAITSLGYFSSLQKKLLLAGLAIAVLVGTYFAVKMGGGFG